MSNVSGVNIRVFIWICNILDAVLCNLCMLKCTVGLHHFFCNYTAGYCSFQYNCSLWIGVAHQEPLVLAMESAHSHQLPPSTYSHWDSKTYSAEAASPWFGDIHGESVVQLCPLSALLALFILWHLLLNNDEGTGVSSYSKLVSSVISRWANIISRLNSFTEFT